MKRKSKHVRKNARRPKTDLQFYKPSGWEILKQCSVAIICFIAAAAVVLLSTFAFGEEASIDGPTTANAGGFVELTANVPDGTPYDWLVIPPPTRQWKDGDILVVCSTPAATYQVVLQLISTGQDGLVFSQLKFGEGDDPPPEPEPEPEPEPSSYSVLFFVESLDADTLPEGQASMLYGRKFREELYSRGHELKGRYDDDSMTSSKQVCDVTGCKTVKTVSAELSEWWTAVQSIPVPCVAFQDLDDPGGTIHTAPLPADAQGLWNLLEGGVE